MRFYNYALIITGMVLFMNLFGVTTTFTGGLAASLNLISSDSTSIGFGSFLTSSIWTSFTLLLGGLAAVGLVAGLFGRAPDIRYQTAAIVSFITSALIKDLLDIATVISLNSEGWMNTVVSIIIGGLIVGLVISAIQFWQGTD